MAAKKRKAVAAGKQLKVVKSAVEFKARNYRCAQAQQSRARAMTLYAALSPATKKKMGKAYQKMHNVFRAHCTSRGTVRATNPLI